ncbi:MAG: hypothetical protein R3C20_12360 [Planctomycetaceae bacterium]
MTPAKLSGYQSTQRDSTSTVAGFVRIRATSQRRNCPVVFPPFAVAIRLWVDRKAVDVSPGKTFRASSRISACQAVNRTMAVHNSGSRIRKNPTNLGTSTGLVRTPLNLRLRVGPLNHHAE